MIQPTQSLLSKLEDFQRWSKSATSGPPISLIDYVGFVATSDLLFAFAALFLPELVVHKGRHFLASGFSTEIYEQWVRTGTDLTDIQRVMNHIHISTLLQQPGVDDDVAVGAANAIATIWSRTLGAEGLVAEAIGDSLEDAAVTFYAGGTQSDATSADE